MIFFFGEVVYFFPIYWITFTEHSPIYMIINEFLQSTSNIPRKIELVSKLSIMVVIMKMTVMTTVIMMMFKGKRHLIC